ncbi:MAG: tetratricopeptide repeat protein [Bdellovibrionota bacterium]
MKDICYWIALIVGLVAVYSPALNGSFIWDDVDLIRDNFLITTPGGLKAIWSSREATDFWPVTNSVFWLEWKFFGERVLGYHLVNLALHAINCFLLSRILRRLEIPFAGAIVAIFAFHPMNVESVAWIFQLKTLLSTTLVLGSALFYLRDRASTTLMSVSLFALALLSKVSVVTWPLALTVFELHRTKSLVHAVKRAAPFLVLSLLAGLVNLRWYPYGSLSKADAINELDSVSRVLLLGWTSWFYFWKTIVPHPLAFLYPRWSIGSNSVVAWLPLVALAVVGGAVAFKTKWRESVFARAIFGYWLLLFPALGLFTIYFQRYSFVADHWHYLALPVAIIVLVVAVGRRLSEKRGLALAAFVVFVFAGLGFEHARHFKGPEAIWTHAIDRSPRAFLAYNNLGLIQYESGRLREAEANFLKALEAKPDYREALLNLGRAKKNEGKFVEAEALYQKAIAVSPSFVTAYINLGSLYGTQRRIVEAESAFGKALALDPKAAVVHFNLAALHQMQGDAASTYRELGLANKVSGLEAYRYGQRERALEFLEAAAKHLPDDSEVQARLNELRVAN